MKDEDEDMKEEDDDTVRAKHESLISQQKHEEGESNMIVVDHSRGHHICCKSPYELYRYISGDMPYTWGESVPVDGESEKYGFVPVNVKRDDHILIVKAVNDLDIQQTRTVIQSIVRDGNPKDVVQILKIMKQISKTMDHEDQDLNHKQLKSLKITNENYNQSAPAVLTLWFADWVCGPVFITRALTKWDMKLSSSVVADDNTRELMKKDNEFFKFKTQYILNLDSEYFVLPGDCMENMDYPKEIVVDYVLITDPGDYNTQRKFKILKIVHADYLDDDSDEDYKYTTCLVEDAETKQKRCKLFYGDEVFMGIASEMREIVNREDFRKWTKNKAGLDLWAGTGENEKIADVRDLKKKLKDMMEENAKLKSKLRENEI